MLVATAPTGMWPTKRFESPNQTKPLVPSPANNELAGSDRNSYFFHLAKIPASAGGNCSACSPA